jgi:hypothetical protein
VDFNDQLIAERVAYRAMMAASAREVLLKFDSDSFIHMEQQAISFATPNDGKLQPHICAIAEKMVKECFYHGRRSAAATEGLGPKITATSAERIEQ